MLDAIAASAPCSDALMACSDSASLCVLTGGRVSAGMFRNSSALPIVVTALTEALRTIGSAAAVGTAGPAPHPVWDVTSAHGATITDGAVQWQQCHPAVPLSNVKSYEPLLHFAMLVQCHRLELPSV
jgi:hypothetical protein